MGSKRAVFIERLMVHVASGTLGGSIFYAAWTAAAPTSLRFVAVAALVALLGYVAAAAMLSRVDGQPRFRMPHFDMAENVLVESPAELLLSEVYQPKSEVPAAREPLLLDDVLAQLGPDSRVVRLFDPARMPTPGQLNARIQLHLGQSPANAAPPDASEALHEALEELRRSLR